MEVEVDEQEVTRSTAEAAGKELRSDDGGSEDRTVTTDAKRHPSAEASENDGKDDAGNQSKKKRCRRKRKAGEHHRVIHRWKPYDEMTWEERQELEEREALRANRKRDKRFASGQPMAPYNTTQFLMEQHDGDDRTPRSIETFNDGRTGVGVTTPTGKHRGDRSGSGEDDSLSDSPYNGFEESYLQRDFIKAYETYRAERLQGMTKDDLVRECLLMEAKLDRLQGTIERLKETAELVSKVREENERLTKENELLKTVNTTSRTATDVREKLATDCVG